MGEAPLRSGWTDCYQIGAYGENRLFAIRAMLIFMDKKYTLAGLVLHYFLGQTTLAAAYGERINTSRQPTQIKLRIALRCFIDGFAVYQPSLCVVEQHPKIVEGWGRPDYFYKIEAGVRRNSDMDI